MDNTAASSHTPYWLIVKHGVRGMSVWARGGAGGERALPVFSHEEEAERFLRLRALEGEWSVKETGSGELVSMLMGPCADASKVLLDPLPEADASMLADLVSLRRESFIGLLVSEPEPLVR